MHAYMILLFWLSWAIIIYTYCFFPILLALLARIYNNKNSAIYNKVACNSDKLRKEMPKIAIVVAAYNEENVIENKLINSFGLRYPEDLLELYIGSDGSTDRTNTILSKYTQPRLNAFLFTTRRGKIAVLNDLVRNVDADIIVMSDANTIFENDALLQLVKHFNDPHVGCVSGKLILEQNGGVSGEGIYWKYETWLKKNESKLGFQIGCNGGIFAMRRDIYTPLPTTTIVEDFVLSMQVLQQGYRVVYEPMARAVEPSCMTARDEMVRKVRIGAGDWQALGLTKSMLNPKYGFISFAFWGHKVLRWTVPHLLLLSTLSCLGLYDQPFYRLVITGEFLGIALSALAYQPVLCKKLPWYTKPVTYFYLMNYALLCGFIRFLMNRQRVTWERVSQSTRTTLESNAAH